MSYIIGRGRQARETYPEKSVVVPAPPNMPAKYYDTSTGDTSTTAIIPNSDIILRQNLGAELGFDIPAQVFAYTLCVNMSGSIAEPFAGGGDFAWVWPVVTGNVIYSGDPVSVGVGGSNQPKAFSGEWRFQLAAGEPASVRFRWGCLFGQGVAVFPNDAALPSRWQVSGLSMPV